MNYGSYLQVFKDDGNMIECVKSMNTHMPECKIVVVSDGGDDFSKHTKNMNFIYRHDTYNIGSGASGFTKNNMLIWLERMKIAFETCESDYMIYLEDDVRITAQFQVSDELVIAGVMTTPIPSVYNEMVSQTKFPGYLYGTCGGSIYRTETFLKEYTNIVKFLDIYLSYGEYGYLDMFMPICYMYLGYKYEENVLLKEITNNSQAWDSPIIHLRPF